MCSGCCRSIIYCINGCFLLNPDRVFLIKICKGQVVFVINSASLKLFIRVFYCKVCFKTSASCICSISFNINKNNRRFKSIISGYCTRFSIIIESNPESISCLFSVFPEFNSCTPAIHKITFNCCCVVSNCV